MNAATAYLREIASHIGKREIGTTNRQEFGREYGWNGVPWCHIFVSVCARRAGVKGLIPWTASTVEGSEWWQGRGQWHRGKKGARPGDICYFWSVEKGRVGHVGVVERVLPDGRLVTIEGNTRNPNKRGGSEYNGGGVYRRIRRTIYGYGRPDWSRVKRWAPGSRVVRRGDVGEDVKAVQRIVGAHPVDGDFGPDTERKVKAWQSQHQLEADGVVGPATWAVIRTGGVEPARPELSIGDTGDAVRRVQRIVGAHPIDGDFGPSTDKMVREFQRRHHLVSDGVVGPATWDALDQAKAGVKPTPPTPAPARDGADLDAVLVSIETAAKAMQSAAFAVRQLKNSGKAAA